MKTLEIDGIPAEPSLEQAVMLSDIWTAYADNCPGEEIESLTCFSYRGRVIMVLKNGVHIVRSEAGIFFEIYADMNEDGRYRWVEYRDYSDAMYFVQ